MAITSMVRAESTTDKKVPKLGTYLVTKKVSTTLTSLLLCSLALSIVLRVTLSISSRMTPISLKTKNKSHEKEIDLL